MSRYVLTTEDISRGLRALGLAPGDAVVVHSSLSSFGHVIGGAETLLAALLETIGPAGTLMAPTMTFERCALPSPRAVPFDPDDTPCDRSMGVLPERLRRHPRALRSAHPLISVAAIGPLAEMLVESQTFEEPYAPYRSLAEHGGKILLLGVGHTRNSSIHAAEYLAGLPYASGRAQEPWYALAATAQGSATLVLRSIAGCSEGFSRLNPYVEERCALIGSCRARLMLGAQVVAAALRLLRNEPASFQCFDPQCSWCSRLIQRGH